MAVYYGTTRTRRKGTTDASVLAGSALGEGSVFFVLDVVLRHELVRRCKEEKCWCVDMQEKPIPAKKEFDNYQRVFGPNAEVASEVNCLKMLLSHAHAHAHG